MQQISKLEVWAGMEYTINRVNDEYFDQLDFSGHYNRPEDIDLIIASGVKTIRYPILWEKHQPSCHKEIDWTFTENNLKRLRAAGITIIAGLVHHGSGPDYVNFFDGTFEDGLQAYAAAVAMRFPWIQFYTPVNEPLTTARFCGLYGHWYPHGKCDETFSRILVSECRATVKAMVAIHKVNPTAKLIQTEDLAKVYSTPALQYQADFENERRWLSFDLITGKVIPSHPLWQYLMAAGIDPAELSYLSRQATKIDIIGLNYYITSERYLDENLTFYPESSHGSNAYVQYADVEAVRVDIPGKTPVGGLIAEAWERYGWPLALTEVHLHCTREEQMRWLHDMWNTALALREENIPVLAVTVWALFGSYDWNNLLKVTAGEYESGAFAIRNNRPEPTALLKLMDALINGHELAHPLLNIPGWWQSTDRILYGGHQNNDLMVTDSTLRPIVIVYNTDIIGQRIEEICRLRKLKCLMEKAPSPDFLSEIVEQQQPWALIDATGELLITGITRKTGYIDASWHLFAADIRSKDMKVAGVYHHLPDRGVFQDHEAFYKKQFSGSEHCLIMSSDSFPATSDELAPEDKMEISSAAFAMFANTVIDYVLDDVKGVHHI